MPPFADDGREADDTLVDPASDTRPAGGIERVCVIGLGQVGLPTALLLADTYDVVGVDVDPDRVRSLNRGQLPFCEPGLPDLFASVRGDFRAREAPVSADAYVIVTPTPLAKRVGVADLDSVRAAGEAIGSVLGPGELVILESTVPPGTTERLLGPILETESGLDREAFGLAHCPERAIPGDTLAEMRDNDRVIGAIDGVAAREARALYASFVAGEIHTTTPTTAELVKLMENTHRDVNIALANEFAKIADEFSVDVQEAISLANEHPRVDILRPGPGVGGHCITIDPQFLARSAAHARLISTAREINDGMANHLLRLVRETLAAGPDSPPGSTLTVFGVAYKGNVADTRETPALPFIELARNAGYEIKVYDPHVETFAIDPEPLDTAVDNSDCIVLLTDHDEFATINPGGLADRMRTRVVVDSRAILDREQWDEAGFRVRVLGDGTTRD